MRLVWNETCLKMCLVSKNGTRLKEWDSFEKVRLVWKNETRLKIWDSCERMRLVWKNETRLKNEYRLKLSSIGTRLHWKFSFTRLNVRWWVRFSNEFWFISIGNWDTYLKLSLIYKRFTSEGFNRLLFVRSSIFAVC